MRNPTNAVGGSFILSLHGALGGDPKSHQRSWWIVHIQPRSDQPKSESERRFRLGMNDPPTALVEFKKHAALLSVGWV